jgi:uncharacterized membrane protein
MALLIPWVAPPTPFLALPTPLVTIKVILVAAIKLQKCMNLTQTLPLELQLFDLIPCFQIIFSMSHPLRHLL